MRSTPATWTKLRSTNRRCGSGWRRPPELHASVGRPPRREWVCGDSWIPCALKGVRLAGARVLGLAAVGGWDPVIFAKLVRRQPLRYLANPAEDGPRPGGRQRVRSAVRGNMKDLSVFKDAAFDVIWHCHSLVFVDDAIRVLKEVGRVMAPGGTYAVVDDAPHDARLYGSYKDGGWRRRSPISRTSRFPTPDDGE